MALAQKEAQRFRHNYIGTEHLLLGLIAEGEGIAAGVLESLGIKLERVRREVLAELGRSQARSSINKPPPVALLATIVGAIVALALLARRRKTF